MGAEREQVAGFGHLENGLRQAGDWYYWGPYVSELEYFHGDNNAAIGAAHQTGWTALIAGVIRRRHGEVQTVGDILRLYGPKAQQ